MSFLTFRAHTPHCQETAHSVEHSLSLLPGAPDAVPVVVGLCWPKLWGR